MAVVIETTIGDFTVDLYTEERPQTCRNFLKLCKMKYYNWNLFHTVQSNFIAQTGDPTGTGKGGESVYGVVLGEKARYYEAEQMPKIKHDRGGLLSMVNCGNNMLGSQFFITLAPHLQSLDGEHCVFGEIAEGLEIILKFNETICDGDHRPYQDIRISHTVILEDPFEDPKGFILPDRSPEPTKEALMSDRIGADEIIDDTAGMTTEEIMEMQREKEAKARATILEIVGDIPDAEMAPPENVLFVCKLNPVTTDDDLEIIFSRFGQIVGCEVIRDRQTGDSLQYAFIEFANRKSCEEAYFKMDNVLIDDRRIHVDFSQSVAKMRWRGKGKGIKYLDEKDQGNRDSPRRDKAPKESRKENNRQDRNKDTGRGQREEVSEHRKHEKRKARETVESVGNGGKYIEKERYREQRHEDSRDRHEQDYRREKERRRHDRDEERRDRERRDRDKERASVKDKNSRARDRGSPETVKERTGRTSKKEHRREKESDRKKHEEKRQAIDSSSSESEASEKEPRRKRKEKRRRKDSDSSGSSTEQERLRSQKSQKRRKAKKHEERRRKESSSSESESEEEREKNHKRKRAKDRSTEARHKQKRR